MTRTLGWLLGIDQLTSIEQIDLTLAAAWAEEGAFWVFLLALTLAAAAVGFYLRGQTAGPFFARLVLGGMRAVLLVLLVVMLADPVLQLTAVHKLPPKLWLVFDGTESMEIRDDLPPEQRQALDRALRLSPGAARRAPAAPAPRAASTAPAVPVLRSEGEAPSRIEYVQAWLRGPGGDILTRLTREQQVEVEAYLFDGNTTSQLRRLAPPAPRGGPPDPRWLAEQLTTRGQVTALGSVLQELRQQSGAARLVGVVLVSDFASNAGPPPLVLAAAPAASQTSVPLYTVGIGATQAIDLAVDLQTDPKLKKAERSSVLVKVQQSGLEGQSVRVRLHSRKLSGEAPSGPSGETFVAEREATLASSTETIELPITPDDSGRFEFRVTADSLPSEASTQNNQATRQVNIIDDYLRLMYVAYEPTWEWRFIKEVFHRDKLVGMEGFRTFLSSSDPRVRESNVLFLPTLTPPRSEFFATDVLFLDDMPRAGLSDRFCAMAKEFVGSLGGGLVVIAGPRFGPRELHQTALADLLPVIVDPNAGLRAAPNHPEFRLRLTPHAARYPFMQLGDTDEENARAWNNLGPLPWYQPVAALHEQAFALAEHPSEKCLDGQTPQPLVAIRPYGKGEVVYLAFNEMWRLRRLYGEKYYRRFWSQLIYRLGMSHALGAEKRFVLRLDQQQYRSEDKVTVTVEAYDENYEPLGDAQLAGRGLAGELTLPNQATTRFVVPLVRRGLFEVRLPVVAAGSYSLRVTDPITDRTSEQRFEVTPVSAERRRVVRDDKLQTELARSTGGRTYDLATAAQLASDLRLAPVIERTVHHYGLWTTPLWFGAVMVLMLGEWTTRKVLRLP